jgi:hypothetical protein
MASVVTTPVNGSVHQKRWEKSRSSGLSSSAVVSGSSGSSVIPQIGQLPG